MSPANIRNSYDQCTWCRRMDSCCNIFEPYTLSLSSSAAAAAAAAASSSSLLLLLLYIFSGGGCGFHPRIGWEKQMHHLSPLKFLAVFLNRDQLIFDISIALLPFPFREEHICLKLSMVRILWSKVGAIFRTSWR